MADEDTTPAEDAEEQELDIEDLTIEEQEALLEESSDDDG